LDILEISPTPAEEQCQQTSTENYAALAKKECRIFKEMLERLFPIPEHLQEDVYFYIKGSPHDFGTYYEVAMKFNAAIPEVVDFVYNVDENAPSRWDETALTQLRKEGLIECE
jgi:hypothetical protein